jgi:hypothetical protein
VPERQAGGPPELPPDVPPEYAEAYLRGYERAYAEAAGLASAGPSPGEGLEPAEPEGEEPADEEPAEPWQFEPPEQQPEDPEATRTWAFEPPGADEDDTVAQPADVDAVQNDPADTAEQEAVDPYEPDDEPDDEPGHGAGHEPGPVVPGFVLWEGRDERYDEPPDVEGYPRWVMPFLAVCLIVLLFVAAYLLA